MSVHQYIHSHPVVGISLTAVCLFTGYTIPTSLDAYHIPQIFMQGLQALAWMAAIAASYYTIRRAKK
jgi:hypothetical protein